MKLTKEFEADYKTASEMDKMAVKHTLLRLWVSSCITTPTYEEFQKFFKKVGAKCS